ncbi:MAG: adenylosuccinate synthase [Candidatus Eremiobacteraeota bacterium]|nr:adenylosuccinate synthase [Candidatus Eremiobacteraeota bacterium]
MTAAADIIVGIQWGDEGKGRIVDLYAGDYDVVARFGGGDNAGHQIKVGDTDIALRIVPSGVLNPTVELFIGGGTVVSLQSLIDELDRLEVIGVDTSRVKISDRAHVVFPYHGAADRENERSLGSSAIGTTGRGIGPAYVDKVARRGITFGDLTRGGDPAERLRANLLARSTLLSDVELPSDGDLIATTLDAARRLAPHVVEGVAWLHERLERGKRVLIEGAQGSLLDVGFGTYPYVTSSHTIAGGACTGLGLGPTAIRRVIGVVKAYCTRVGGGPFPSELHGEQGERLRRAGGEFGTVTGRPRRCGWFDAVAGRYAARLNGLAALALTKLDVLSGMERIAIVTGYRLNAKDAGFAEAGANGLTTTIEEMDGWSEPIEGVRTIAALPKAAQAYVRRIEQLLAVPVEVVSVGRERSQLAR